VGAACFINWKSVKKKKKKKRDDGEREPGPEKSGRVHQTATFDGQPRNTGEEQRQVTYL